MTLSGLVDKLKRDGVISDALIEEAFLKIDRANFVTPEYKRDAYGDFPLPIGGGQTISQPYTVAFMLSELAPKPGQKILDVGTGSGWQAALLGYIVSHREGGGRQAGGSGGRVIGIERIPALAEFARKNIEKYKMLSQGTVEVIVGDGTTGYEKESPYDGIIAAASGREIPQAWKRQLKIGGKIVAPVSHSVITSEKIAEDKFRTVERLGFSFVPLVSEKRE